MTASSTYRIYIEDLVPTNIDPTLLIKYETHRRHLTTFYTDIGIFRLYNNAIHQLEFEEGEIKKNLITSGSKDISTFIDTSKIKKGKQQHQVPYGYTVQRIEEVSYRLEKHANTRLVIELENKQPVDIYFDTAVPHHSPEVYNTILTFLSQLKFC
jgi:hypothetical protein